MIYDLKYSLGLFITLLKTFRYNIKYELSCIVSYLNLLLFLAQFCQCLWLLFLLIIVYLTCYNYQIFR